MLKMLQLLQQVPQDNIPGAVWPIYTNGDIALCPLTCFESFDYICASFLWCILDFLGWYLPYVCMYLFILLCTFSVLIIHLIGKYIFCENSHIIIVRKVISQLFWYTNICISYKFQHSKITRYTLIESMYVHVFLCMYMYFARQKGYFWFFLLFRMISMCLFKAFVFGGYK